jgi:hypothetical protein
MSGLCNRSNRIVTGYCTGLHVAIRDNEIEICRDKLFDRMLSFPKVSNFIQTPWVDRRIFLMGPILGGSDVALYPDGAPFADNRFDCCDLLQRSVIHHGTGKASGISSWYSCQTDRLPICLKRRTSGFGALGPFRTCEPNLKPWAMHSWSRQFELARA